MPSATPDIVSPHAWQTDSARDGSSEINLVAYESKKFSRLWSELFGQ